MSISVGTGPFRARGSRRYSETMQDRGGFGERKRRGLGVEEEEGGWLREGGREERRGGGLACWQFKKNNPSATRTDIAAGKCNEGAATSRPIMLPDINTIHQRCLVVSEAQC